MRRLRSSVALSALLAGGARAQEVSGSEGALFLLLPTGAQAVGMGQAMVAAKPGSEGIWWNPASIAGAGKARAGDPPLRDRRRCRRCAARSSLRFATCGTVALSINILNIGEQQVTDRGR